MTVGSLPEPLEELTGALRQFEGCLGIRVATAEQGMIAVFAWFENKAAARRWYFSDIHLSTIRRYFPDHTPKKPLEHVHNENEPILVIASFTPELPPSVDSSNSTPHFPYTQASVELYRPMAGGVYFGGRFAPDSLEIPPSTKPWPE